MLGSLGLPELLVIFLIVIVIFGAGKIPQLGKGMGEGIKNFRDAIKSGAEGKDAKDAKEKKESDAK
ncbi:MAG TPA: twin-arginine translocase TatA/TatE family subunit [Thermoanaerobaculia bacterium]|jgi:sec-independent protein translocase protein TatA|nr:twin-arginine translocase TatA/TatE family subunit [Thermoanaerobaculia bacterium]